MEPITQLLQACARGDGSTVSLLLDQGLNVDSHDEAEVTPLQMASAFGQEKMVCLLLSRGAALDTPNTCGWTPLMHAARQGHTNTVALLLQHKAKVNMKNRLGATALSMTVRSGKISVLRLLLDAGADIRDDKDHFPCELSLLMIAAQNGNDSLVKILLDRGVDVNYVAPHTGYTALMFAACNGHKNIVQVLCERGADANLANVCDKTALDIAILRGKRTVKDYLENKTKVRITLDDVHSNKNVLEATKNGHFDLVRDLLVEEPAQKDMMQAGDGATPLMFAAMMGRLDLVELLVQMGADMNIRDTVSGWTALMQAIFHSKNDVAKYLIEAGADINAQAFNGCTAFDLASLMEEVHADVIRLLAARTLQVPMELKHTRSNSGSIIPDLLFMEDNNLKAPKSWWNRMSNQFRHLKLGKIFRPHHLSTDKQRPTRSFSDSSTVVELSSPLPQNDWDSNPKEKMKSPTSSLTLALPSVSLVSDKMKPVVPPTLPLPIFNASSLLAYGMPPGRLSSMNTSKLISPVPPVQLTKSVSLSAINNLVDSRRVTNATPLASKEKVIPDRKMLGLKTEPNLAENKLASDGGKSPVSIKRESFYIYKAKKDISGGCQEGLATLSTSKSYAKLHNSSESQKIPDVRKSASSKSSRSSKSSSTLTPSQSEIGDKSLSSSDCGLLGKTLQPSNENDEVAAILKKLALERYCPIFEEQEVDVEALLSLTDQDLVDLGIQPTDSRQRLLHAIDKMNLGKWPLSNFSTLNHVT